MQVEASIYEQEANQIFKKMLQNILKHLIHFSTEVSLENNSWKDLICLLVYHHLSYRDEFAWKKVISNASKIEVARTSFILTYYFKNSLFSYAKNCMSKFSVLQFS